MVHSKLNIRFSLFTAILLVVTASILSLVGLEVLSTKDFLGLIAFSVLAVLAESYPLEVPFGKAHLGWSTLLYWSLIILYEPAWAGISVFMSFLLAQVAVKKHDIVKAVFNASQAALSIMAACVVFTYINQGIIVSIDSRFILAFGSAAITYWVINTWLVSFGAYFLYRENTIRFWRKNFQWTFFFELASAPLALLVAYAYLELWLIGLLLVTLPILMVRLAYSQYIELKKTYRETVRTLVKIIEMHDPYTAGHSDRVATYARRLCEAVGLSPAKTERIELAAFLHDLGKINLDLSGIVKKAGKLTEEEKRLIRLHSVVSADLANQVSYFRGEIEAMIRHHHENWDGSGYPHGLKGEDIPLGSRIILLADAFDAMTTSRVYREALDLERVKDEFKKFAGIQFDPKLVDPFLDRVVGDGSGLIKQPIDEPLEGQRARSRQTPATGEVRSIRIVG